MLYIVCALKSESHAFVDKYKLSKTKQNAYVTVIVSGIGSKNMFDTTKQTVNIVQEDDVIINHSKMKKFGFVVGELVITIIKEK